MNRLLRKILESAGEAALSAGGSIIPGGPVLIGGVRKLLDHDHTNNSEAIEDVGNGLIAAINGLKGEQVVNEALVAQGVLEVRSGLSKIKAGIR